MTKTAINFRFKILLWLFTSFCLFTCGLEESYFLPQVEENQIIPIGNNLATANIPQISSVHYYATGYKIFYRIYLSSEVGGSWENTSFSSTYVQDFNYFYNNYNNPSVSASTFPTITTFSGRGYYELDYFLDKSGGLIEITFPTDLSNPFLTLNGGSRVELQRYKNYQGIVEFVPSNAPDHETYLRNTKGLNESIDSTTRKNLDVTGQVSNNILGHAYVAMYIVAVGSNPTSFQTIFGKPTFISVFKLQNVY